MTTYLCTCGKSYTMGPTRDVKEGLCPACQEARITELEVELQGKEERNQVLSRKLKDAKREADDLQDQVDELEDSGVEDRILEYGQAILAKIGRVQEIRTGRIDAHLEQELDELGDLAKDHPEYFGGGE